MPKQGSVEYINPNIMSLLDLLTLFPHIFLAMACYFIITLFLSHKTGWFLVNWPLLGNLPSLVVNTNRLHDWCTQILSRSGGTLALKGPWFVSTDTLLTCNPDNVHHILVTNFSNFPKGPEYSEMFDLLGDGIFNADSDSWRQQRQMAHIHLNSRPFRQYLAKTSRVMMEKGLMPVLAQAAQKDQVVDLQDVFLRFTFDSACALIFGVEAHCLSIEPEFPNSMITAFAKAVDDAEEAIFYRYIMPGKLWKLLRWLRMGKEKKLAKARETIDHFITHCILNRRREYLLRKRTEEEKEEMGEKKRVEQGSDLLTSYMESQLEVEDGNDNFLRDNTLNLFIAGRDTTSAALTWFFWLVSKNPKVEMKIMEELRQKAKFQINKGCSSNKPRVFETGVLGGMVYLHAALCESLRLFPPLPIDQKGVRHPQVLPSGHVAQPGMKVMYSIYATGRMEWIWGEDCLDFKPERWITNRGEFKFEPPCKFIAFNAGPRTCLGKDIALTQMKAVAAAVLYNFHVKVLEGHPVLPKTSVMLFMKHGLMVRLKARERDTID